MWTGWTEENGTGGLSGIWVVEGNEIGCFHWRIWLVDKCKIHLIGNALDV